MDVNGVELPEPVANVVAQRDAAIDILRRVWMATFDDHEFLMLVDGPRSPDKDRWVELLAEVHEFVTATAGSR